jgi:hypothetical protein
MPNVLIKVMVGKACHIEKCIVSNITGRRKHDFICIKADNPWVGSSNFSDVSSACFITSADSVL